VSDDNKRLVVRWVEEAINAGRLEVLPELCLPDVAAAAERWIAPFRESFPDVEMDVVDLVAEGDKVVGRFTCSGTNLGVWSGRPPTGRRFENVDEVYFFRFDDGKIAEFWGLEDTQSRLRQLGASD
jgi:steroid delta-isomerase-like uncharacterized protein